MKLVEVSHGIAYRDDEHVYMNRVLHLDKRVWGEVFLHELNHDSGEYNWNDFKLDMCGCSWRSQWFCLKHPSTWTAFSPVVRFNGVWYYDVATLFNVGCGFLLGGIVCLLIF